MNTTDSAKRIEGFEDTVKDFWVSRPRRPHHGRKLAGVASGIGYRYGIDPTVVRVIAAVAMLFTVPLGPLAYVVLWAVMPRG